MNARHAGFINMTALELEMNDQVNAVRGDVFEYLKKNRNRKSYELIVADPPFEMEVAKYEELISLVLKNNYLKENGVFILEHQSRTKLGHPNIIDTRKYGNVSFSFLKPNEPTSEETTETGEQTPE